jgi:hypothetical protein
VTASAGGGVVGSGTPSGQCLEALVLRWMRSCKYVEVITSGRREARSWSHSV